MIKKKPEQIALYIMSVIRLILLLAVLLGLYRWIMY
jgi:hypothetical protein